MKLIIDIPEDAIQRYKDGLIQLPNIYGIQEILDSIKPFDSFPEREKGEWIRFKNFESGYFHIKCSNCGQYWSIDDHAKTFKYCFNCGADMRGGKE